MNSFREVESEAPQVAPASRVKLPHLWVVVRRRDASSSRLCGYSRRMQLVCLDTTCSDKVWESYHGAISGHSELWKQS